MINRAAILTVAAVFLMAPTGKTYSTAIPPVRHQNDGAGVVVYTSDIEAWCGPSDPGTNILACHRITTDGVGVTILPNPCILAQYEVFARLACHEAGHRQGWSGMHED